MFTKGVLMPKIIENLESRILAEAKKQIEEAGYSAVTIRSIAAGCGVGIGTVYNYFPSKDALLATYMLRDWKDCIAVIQAVSNHSGTAQAVARSIYDQLVQYAQRHQAIFQDASASAGFAGSFSRYHTLLRSQLAEPLRKFCTGDFPAEFIAEALLTWTMAGKNFDDIYGMIGKLL